MEILVTILLIQNSLAISKKNRNWECKGTKNTKKGHYIIQLKGLIKEILLGQFLIN